EWIGRVFTHHVNVIRRQHLAIDEEIIESNQRIHQWHNFSIPWLEITGNFIKEQKQQSPSDIAEVSYFKPAGNQRNYFAGANGFWRVRVVNRVQWQMRGVCFEKVIV